MQQTLSWKEIIYFALGSGLVSALVTQLFAWFTRRRDEETKARRTTSFLAISVAAALENFAMKCASVASDIELYRNSEGAVGDIGKLPELPAYPTNLDWTGLEASLCSRAFSLRNEWELSLESINMAFQINGHPNDGAETRDQAANIGLRAWQLAADLRRYYDLPHLRVDEYSWNFPDKLEKEVDRVRLEALARS